MIRKALVLAAVLVSSCASIKPGTPDLSGLLASILSEDTGPSVPTVCPPWIKLEGEITDASAQAFVKTLALCEDHPVVVEINSPGGSWFAALEMDKAIERHPHTVICAVDGMAASAAFITLQSCDLRMMTDRSMLMAHQASLPAKGQEQELENAVLAAKTLDRAIAVHCAKAMDMDPKDFETQIAKGREWWMGEEEAVANHAIDLEGSVQDALLLVH